MDLHSSTFFSPPGLLKNLPFLTFSQWNLVRPIACANIRAGWKRPVSLFQLDKSDLRWHICPNRTVQFFCACVRLMNVFVSRKWTGHGEIHQICLCHGMFSIGRVCCVGYWRLLLVHYLHDMQTIRLSSFPAHVFVSIGEPRASTMMLE